MHSAKIKVILSVVLATVFISGVYGFFMSESREQTFPLTMFFAFSPFAPWYFVATSEELFTGSIFDVIATLVWVSIWPPIAFSPLYSYWKKPNKIKLAVFVLLWLSIGALEFSVLRT